MARKLPFCKRPRDKALRRRMAVTTVMAATPLAANSSQLFSAKNVSIPSVLTKLLRSFAIPGALEHSRRLAVEYATRAKDSLSVLPDSEFRRALLAIPTSSSTAKLTPFFGVILRSVFGGEGCAFVFAIVRLHGTLCAK